MAFVYVIDGDMGGGKTSFMSLMACYLSSVFPNLTVWSNYGLKGSRPFTSYKDFLEMASLDSSLVLLDEAYLTFDSRLFGSKGQIYFTELLYYLRKIRATIMFTAVDWETLDTRIRRVVDVYIFARKERGFHIYEFFHNKSGKLLKRVQIPVSRMQMILNHLDVYKTWKIVRPTELPDKDFHTFVEWLDMANESYYAGQENGGAPGGVLLGAAGQPPFQESC